MNATQKFGLFLISFTTISLLIYRVIVDFKFISSIIPSYVSQWFDAFALTFSLTYAIAGVLLFSPYIRRVLILIIMFFVFFALGLYFAEVML
ncbi:MAG: hypothetical protein ACP5M8_08205 [Caldisphaera sp.]